MYLAEPDPAQPPMIIMMDPPEHTLMRKLVNKVFTPRAIADLESMIRREDHRSRKYPPSGTAFDVVADFGAIFQVEVISTMLGVLPGGSTTGPAVVRQAAGAQPRDFHPPGRRCRGRRGDYNLLLRAGPRT